MSFQSVTNFNSFPPATEGTDGSVLTLLNNKLAWATGSGVTSANNLVGGTSGSLPYQVSSGTTSFTDSASSAGLLLTSGTSGTGKPTWTNPNTLTVSSALTSTNLKSTGGAGQIP